MHVKDIRLAESRGLVCGLHGYERSLIGEKCAFWFLGAMQINVSCFWGN